MVKYELVMRDIAKRIATGEWTEGMLMPTENELCGIYGVSRITVRRALDELERKGAVERIQGKGTFIRERKEMTSAARKGFKSTMADQGLTVTSRLITKEIIKTPQFVKDQLPMPKGENRCWHLVRVRKFGDTPVAYTETYVPMPLGNIMTQYDLSEESFYELYERIFDKPIGDTSGFITAVNVTGWTARFLGMEENSAAILFKSVAYLSDGRPLHVDFSYYNPRYHQFSYDLNRNGGEPMN